MSQVTWFEGKRPYVLTSTCRRLKVGCYAGRYGDRYLAWFMLDPHHPRPVGPMRQTLEEAHLDADAFLRMAERIPIPLCFEALETWLAAFASGEVGMATPGGWVLPEPLNADWQRLAMDETLLYLWQSGTIGVAGQNPREPKYKPLSKILPRAA